MTPAQRRLRWVKKDRLPASIQAQLAQRDKNKKDNKEAAAKLEKEPSERKPDGTAAGAAAGEKKEIQETILYVKNDYLQLDFTKSDNVAKKLKEVQDDRMRGKYDPKFHIQMLTYILNQVKDSTLRIEVILNLLNSLFDSAKVSLLGFMNRDTWLSTHNYLNLLMNLLETDSFRDSLRNFQRKEKTAAALEDADVETETNELSTTIEIEKAILPALANFIEKLDYELLKAFQNTPHNKIEYLQRLRDDNKFLFLCDRLQRFMTDFNDLSKVARVAIIKLDHLYYKSDALYVQLKQAPASDESNKPYILENSLTHLTELGSVIN